MKTFSNSISVELMKIYTRRAWWVICTLIIVQPFLGWIVAKSYVQIGLDATPETHPELLEPLPPLDYIGFEVVLVGLLPMIVFGAILGASEFKHHELRTTLLYQNSRFQVFLAKVFAILASSTFLSILTIFATISMVHVGLSEQGLHPFQLSRIAWQFIGFSALDWILLTILASGLGMLFKNAMVPLVFLIPQVYNLGNYLAQKWEWAEYLPVAAGQLLFATPTDSFEHDPLKGGIVLSIWVMVALGISYFTFIRSDVGGKY